MQCRPCDPDEPAPIRRPAVPSVEPRHTIRRWCADLRQMMPKSRLAPDAQAKRSLNQPRRRDRLRLAVTLAGALPGKCRDAPPGNLRSRTVLLRFPLDSFGE